MDPDLELKSAEGGGGGGLFALPAAKRFVLSKIRGARTLPLDPPLCANLCGTRVYLRACRAARNKDNQRYVVIETYEQFQLKRVDNILDSEWGSEDDAK